jgi:hypothetical protein
MKKILVLILLTFVTFSMSARSKFKQPFPGGHYTIYRLTLTDKKGSPGNLNHPESFLSAKALQRRQRQGLTVDSTDLPLSASYLRQLKAQKAELIGKSKWNNTVLVKTTHEAEIKALTALPFVVKATRVFTSPDSIVPEKPDTLFRDTLTARSAGHQLYGRGQHQIDMLDGTRLHEAGFRGKGMLIAIVDGGYMNVDKIPYLRHVNIVGTKDFAYPYNANLYQLLDHGTMVLSCMATQADSLFIGTAPDASYLLLRSEYGPTESLIEEDYWAQAVEYADSIGADIVNSSLGYNQFDDPTMNHLYREQDGRTALISNTASMLSGKGMILVNSAGNTGARNWKRIGFPGDARDVLTVAALSADSINATFSSVGPSFDGRVKPDVAALGVASTVIDGRGAITRANGTSFATPITCGMVACLWQALPDKTASQIMDLVRRSADRHDHPDNIYGYGIPDFWKAYQMGKAQ